MYRIILHNWKDERPEHPLVEILPKKFETLRDAYLYLGQNIDRLKTEFPFEKIEVKKLK